MEPQKIGILHPGAMGISIAASAQNSGHLVYWASEGRSPQSRERAAQHNLIDTITLAALCETCSTLISVCPPDAAEKLANQVLAYGFNGLYIDANAISPDRAQRIGRAMATSRATFVDGGIIGGPAWEPNRTWLYLSGDSSERAAALFDAGPLETDVIGHEIGKASALKMCFAAYTKGTTALLSAVMAAADNLDVRADLERQWSHNGSDFAQQATTRVQRVTAKAWRFAGEMDEIADTFDAAGLPAGFHQAAGIIYQRIAKYKAAPELPAIEDVLTALNRSDSDSMN